MSAKFSEKLINDITDYFKKHRNIEITPDEADAYLLSLADLYLAMSKADQERFEDCGLGGTAARRAAEPHPTYPC